MSFLPSRRQRSQRRRFLLVCLVAAAPILASLSVTVPAEATTFTAQGQRCTEVGTPGDDVLVGTSGRDVICGLGGDDVIRGRDGNDVIDGGRGSDDVYGGGGADDLLGGSGGDDVSGGAGADDVLGGPGGDDIEGDSGADDIFGQGGNDDLNGGRGSDDVYGGDGTNWCTLDSRDTGTRCKYDTQAPSADGLQLSRSFADVTDGDKFGTARIHVVDDTGVTRVSVSGYEFDGGSHLYGGDARLVSGTVRDGWWVASIAAHRWTEPGTITVGIGLRDRVGRQSSREYPGVFRIADRNPDLNPPTVTLRRPTASDPAVDVRTEAKTVVIEARIRDAVSGVSDGSSFCIHKPVDGFYTNLPCPIAVLVSGTRYDGIWRAKVRIPRGETGGDWNVSINAGDIADSGDRMWMGPDLWSYWTNGGQTPDPSFPQLPGGAGRFSVRGTMDSVPPKVTGVTINPSHIDTLPGPQTVKFAVQAADAANEGVQSVGLYLHPGDASTGSGVDLGFLDLRLTSGTKVNGTWTGSLTIPQGTPPGTYYAQVMVNDRTHYRSYFSPGSPYASDPGALLLPDPSELVVDPNPAG